MSLAELTANRIPRYSLLPLQRKLQRASTQLTKATSRTRRKTVRQAAAWYRRQYFVSHAYADLTQAVSRNEDIFLASLITTVVLAYAFATSGTQLLLFSFQSMSAVSDVTGISLSLLTLITLGVLATCSAWLLAFVINSLSISVMDGALRRHHVSLRTTLRRSLARTSRFSIAYLLLLSIITLGLLIIALPAALYAYTHFRHSHINAGFVVLTALSTLGVLYGLSSFCLAPQVALFETDVPFWRTPLRSYELTRRRGRLFVLAIIAALGISLTASFYLSAAIEHIFDFSGAIIFYTLGVTCFVGANLMLAMLYRKRKLARKH